MEPKKLKDLEYYLDRVVKDNASDLFIVAGSPVSEKKGDKVLPVDEEDGSGSSQKVMPAGAKELVAQIYRLANRTMVDGCCDDDFAFTVPGLARFRVNTYRQRGSIAAVVRKIDFKIPTSGMMNIPDEVMELANQTDGMILVTGTAGSGKSTTQACIIDRISQEHGGHIITLEDPIEYVHRNNNGDNPEKPHVRSIVSQREVAIDTEDYPSALRACLRQAPNVILLGEMRDRETIQTAMTAAETGHLVIATLHTKGAANAVDRIVDAFPGDQQKQIRAQLSMVLRAVVSQQLLPMLGGGQVPAYEIMYVNNAIRSLIRDNKINQIDNAIAQDKDEDEFEGEREEQDAYKGKQMWSMDRYILRLLDEGKISEETAQKYINNKEWGKRMMKRSQAKQG